MTCQETQIGSSKP